MNAIGGAAANIFREVNYIPLETTKESLFGEINQLLVTTEYFIVLDQNATAILFFDKAGKFHHKISKFNFDRVFKQDPRPGIRNITIVSIKADPGKQQLYIQTAFERQSLYVYSYDGTRIGKIALPPNTQDYQFLQDGTGIYMQQRPVSADQAGYMPFDLAIRREPAGIPQYLLPVDFRYAALSNDLYRHMSYLTYSGNPWQCLYIPDFDYRVQELDTAGIRHTYQFIFPLEYSIPDNFGYDSSYTGRRRAYLEGKNVFTQLWNVYKTGDYLVVDLRCPCSGWETTMFTLLYSLKTTRVITLDRVSPDATTSWLPVSGYGRSELLASDGQYLYTSYPSLTMFAAKEAADEKQAAYSPVLKNYFTTQDRKSNPVIVQLRPKANL